MPGKVRARWCIAVDFIRQTEPPPPPPPPRPLDRSWRCLCLTGERGSDGIPSRRIRRLIQHTVLAKSQLASSLADLDVVLHKLSPGHNDLSFAQFCHVVVVTTASILKTRSRSLRKPEPARVLGKVMEMLAAYVNREGRELDPLQLAAARAAFQQQTAGLQQIFASYSTEGVEPEVPPILTKGSALALAKDLELTTLLSWHRIESLWRYLVDFGDFSMSTLPAGQGATAGQTGSSMVCLPALSPPTTLDRWFPPGTTTLAASRSSAGSQQVPTLQGLRFDQFVTWMCAVALKSKTHAPKAEMKVPKDSPEARVAWLLQWISQVPSDRQARSTTIRPPSPPASSGTKTSVQSFVG